MAESPAKKSTLESVQMLRGIAALSVVFFHLHILHKGSIGVDIFFVISGFIIGIVGAKENVRSFSYKRFIRIVPIYWIVTIFLSCLYNLHLIKTVDFSLKNLVFSLFFVPYYNIDGRIWPILVPGWTLDFEILFYLIFCLGIFFKSPRFFSGLIIIIFFLLGILIPARTAVWMTVTSPRMVEFLFGLIISVSANKLNFFGGFIMLSFGCIIMGAILLGVVDGGEQIDHLLIVGVPAAAMVGGAVAIDYLGCWPNIPVMSYLGNLSYSLYLTNSLAIAGVERMLGPNHRFIAFGELLISLAVAALTYHFIEQPSLTALRRWSPVCLWASPFGERR